MISFYAKDDFHCENQDAISNWINDTIRIENYEEGDIDIIFCDDSYLHQLNVEFLKHDTLTDIISFDYSIGKQIHGEIYISVERVRENTTIFNTDFENELHRVIIHGILHYCGYKDKTEAESKEMKLREEEALARRSFV